MTKAETISQLQSELEKLTKTLMEVNKDTYIIKDVLHNSDSIAPQTTATIEILAGRSGAFKPTEIQMYGLTDSGTRCSITTTDKND